MALDPYKRCIVVIDEQSHTYLSTPSAVPFIHLWTRATQGSHKSLRHPTMDAPRG